MQYGPFPIERCYEMDVLTPGETKLASLVDQTGFAGVEIELDDDYPIIECGFWAPNPFYSQVHLTEDVTDGDLLSADVTGTGQVRVGYLRAVAQGAGTLTLKSKTSGTIHLMKTFAANEVLELGGGSRQPLDNPVVITDPGNDLSYDWDATDNDLSLMVNKAGMPQGVFALVDGDLADLGAMLAGGIPYSQSRMFLLPDGATRMVKSPAAGSSKVSFAGGQDAFSGYVAASGFHR